MEEFDHPPENRGVEVLVRCEVSVEEKAGGVDDGDTAVAFSADGVVEEGLGGGELVS